MKVLSLVRRAHRPKGATDLADLQRLPLAFPALKVNRGAVASRLARLKAEPTAMARCNELVLSRIEPDVEDF